MGRTDWTGAAHSVQSDGRPGIDSEQAELSQIIFLVLVSCC